MFVLKAKPRKDTSEQFSVFANFCASIAHEAKKHIPNILHFFASYATSFGPKLLCFMSFKPSSIILVPKPVLP